MVRLFLCLWCAVGSASSDEFMWGVATSAYQIEGGATTDGRGPSIWDTFTHDTLKTNHQSGDIADLSYFKVEEDLQLILNLNVKYYRFSLSWSRIFPNGRASEVNPLGVQYYNRLIDLLLEAGVTPVVTLYHWDLPQALEDDYLGWLDSNIQVDFLNYAEACFTFFGDRVKWWITINEPWTFAVNGYVTGINAPGRCSDRLKCAEGNSSTEAYLVAHNVLGAHSRVVELYRRRFQKRQNGKIGITLNIDWSFPLNYSSSLDVAAAERRNEFMFGWFADPIFFGFYPASMRAAAGDRLPMFRQEERHRLVGSLDFLGFNHYSSWYVTEDYSDLAGAKLAGDWFVDQRTVASKFDLHGRLIGPQGASPWLNTVPEGMKAALCWVDERYNHPIILITENGCDVPGESSHPLPSVLNDPFRIDYYSRYLASVAEAILLGVDVRGYFAWSLLDNFEWGDGYSMRFGLYYVDYNSSDRTRHAKMSSLWYADYVLSHPAGPIPTVNSEGNPQGESVTRTTLPSIFWSLLSRMREVFQNRDEFFLLGHYFVAP